MKPGEKGKGSVYQRGGIWWIKYHRLGKPYRESANTDNEEKARRFLKFRLGQITRGRFVEPHLERILVRDLWEPFLKDLRRNERKDIEHAETRWTNHLEGDMRVAEVTGSRLGEYVDSRKAEKAMNSTIARELAVLQAHVPFGLLKLIRKRSRVFRRSLP